MTGDEAGELLKLLCAAWPSAPFPEPTAKLYAVNLMGMELEPAARAVRALIASSRFLPSIAELRAAYAAEAESVRARNRRALPTPAERTWTAEERAANRKRIRDMLVEIAARGRTEFAPAAPPMMAREVTPGHGWACACERCFAPTDAEARKQLKRGGG